MSPNGRRASCGIDLNCVPDIRECLLSAAENKYDFTCLPIAHSRYKREFLDGKAKDRYGPFTRSDLVLSSSDWTAIIVGKISPYIDVDSEDDTYRRQSEETLAQELMYASHLNLCAVLVPLTSVRVTNLARIICSKITSLYSYQIWVRVPMESQLIQAATYRSDCDEDILRADPKNEPWEWWNIFRSLCNFERRVGVALEVSADLPSQEKIDRWLGEPIHCLILATSLFLTNKKGYPVLSKAHQCLIRQFMPLNVQIVITGVLRHASIHHYQSYIDYLWQHSHRRITEARIYLFTDRSQTFPRKFIAYEFLKFDVPSRIFLPTAQFLMRWHINARQSDPLIGFGRGYEDFLQSPLQPLSDNLESHTYEVFEKDPVKYSEYSKAIEQAIIDKVPDCKKQFRELVVMVLGAGRGPLVTAVLNAAEKTGREVKTYAVEKNPNAVVTLLAQKEEIWLDRVTVHSCDMRKFKPMDQADILVSELLGSFGDNELSPECLDGAQNFLRRDGICIPSQYTSYLCPVQTSKLYNEVRMHAEKDKNYIKSFETPYVVHQQNRMELSSTVPLFQFNHPNNDRVVDNTRYKCITFPITQNCTLHGFSGYFDTVLYKDVTLSIVPETHSAGMFSWFPIFFPIKEPVHLKTGDNLVVHFWRLTDSKKVWYEWTITEPIPIAIHNPKGRSYTIGL